MDAEICPFPLLSSSADPFGFHITGFIPELGMWPSSEKKAVTSTLSPTPFHFGVLQPLLPQLYFTSTTLSPRIQGGISVAIRKKALKQP